MMLIALYPVCPDWMGKQKEKGECWEPETDYLPSKQPWLLFMVDLFKGAGASYTGSEV